VAGLDVRERAHGALLGLAIGDALGAPLEFSDPRETAAAVERGLEMNGGGVWRPGEWTDDTAMALALAESISERGLLDLDDLARRYAAWAASGPKDIGITTRVALSGATCAQDARENASLLHAQTGRTAGNGTVMRAAPTTPPRETPAPRSASLCAHSWRTTIRSRRQCAWLETCGRRPRP
jgi:ADP-ribosyl-[dinitrogen reductase] hydrolase